ncbi:MAG: Trm112 family protein [Fimbriimonadales bacterium]|nr:Trm112 family protein [Fimbriimonadales bacterium]
MPVLNPELLAILACPACEERPPLEQRGDYLVCRQCRRAYPIRDEIPVLLVEEAIEAERIAVDDTPPEARQNGG